MTIFYLSSTEGPQNHEGVGKNASFQYGQDSEWQHGAGFQGRHKRIQRQGRHLKDCGQADIIKVEDGLSIKASGERCVEIGYEETALQDTG